MSLDKNEFQIENVFSDLVHYYEVRMSSFSDFSTRTWNRFNWFMTVHLGAFAFIFSNLLKVEHSNWYLIVTISIGVTALVWCLLGYEDFKQMQRYGVECKEIERVFLETLAERESIKFNFEKRIITDGFSPFKHSRILYLFPIFIFTACCTLSIYLF